MSGEELRAALIADLDAGISTEAIRLTEFIVESFGEATAAVIHYGSQSHSTTPRLASAYDFFVIVDDSAAAYRSFVARRDPRFTARTATNLAAILPPSIIGVTLSGDDGETLRGKCAVMSLRHFVAACSSGSKDHFTRGRLFQPVRMAWVRDVDARRKVEDALVAARASTFEWVRPSLPVFFDAGAYCRKLLSTSYAGEIRLEKSHRHAEVFDLGHALLVPIYEALLADMVRQKALELQDGSYRLVALVTPLERMRTGLYFRRSKLRGMMRWGKSIALYDRWLDYLREKAERRIGAPIEFSPRERRWPLIFLWPKALRLLSTRR